VPVIVDILWGCSRANNVSVYVASDASGYPLCQKRLVGALPNPLSIAEVPSAAARFANASIKKAH